MAAPSLDTAGKNVSAETSGGGGGGGGVRYLPTSEAYDRWAAVYDTDGNFLQALDDVEMAELFPRFLAALTRDNGDGGSGGNDSSAGAVGAAGRSRGLRIVDLGCGTGRNTALLLGAEDGNGIGEIVALDASPGMLEVAKGRLLALDRRDGSNSTRDGEGEGERQSSGNDNDNTSTAGGEADGSQAAATPTMVQIRGKTVTFALYDIIAEASSAFSSSPSSSSSSALQQQQQQKREHLTAPADGVISTLVMEHTPLTEFFSCASRLLAPGGVLLLTNMHAHMGGVSQAGFVDGATGEKVRPLASYAHAVGDVVAEASRWGLEVVMPSSGRGGGIGGGIKETAVDESMVERLGPRSRKWVGVTCWFGGLFRKSL
ncbi:methyltransferase domain-containing protein [Microdochium nivale]|nr:methyltransferase domain-containing protein [Microdochium nivale]